MELTADQQDELKSLFKTFDLDGSGKITRKEFLKCFRYLGHNPTRKEVEHMIGKVDKDGDRMLDFSEFIQLALSHPRIPFDEGRKEDFQKAFHAIDRNQDGVIQREEFILAMTKYGQDPLSETEARSIFDYADTNADGVLDWDEFFTMVKAYMT